MRARALCWIVAGMGLVGFAAAGRGADTVAVKDGDRIAFAGDSITEQRLYTVQAETYLVACSGLETLRCRQFGWAGEQSGGLAARMENDIAPWKPTVVTLLYGMNDGQRHRAYADDIGNQFRGNLEKITDFFQGRGARVLLLSPTCVDPGKLRGSESYNPTLGRLGDIARDIAKAKGAAFHDLNPLMNRVMAESKAKYGQNFSACGDDGVHPQQGGHLVIAQAVLEGLGVGDPIADLRMDYATGDAEVSPGHVVQAAKPGEVRLTSRRYPYCFPGGDPSGNTRHSAVLLPWLDFMDRLNQFRLTVANLGAPKAKVRWGAEEKEFTAGELGRGVNLAAAFFDNPFRRQFMAIQKAIGEKQLFEMRAVKGVLSSYRQVAGYNLPGIDENFRQLSETLERRQLELEKQVAELHVAIDHTVTITPVP